MWVKACGITRLEDALAAARMGYSAIGLIFAESPRRIDPERARRIASTLPGGMVKVGVFVNEDLREVRRIGEYCDLDLFQFHGEESPSYVAAFGAKAIKAFRVGEEYDPGAVLEYPQGFSYLIDSWNLERRGGTGTVGNWEVAASLARSFRLILAGGLNPGNVAEAVRVVHPFGLDVSSGIEVIAGIKERSKMESFIQNVRMAERRITESRR